VTRYTRGIHPITLVLAVAFLVSFGAATRTVDAAQAGGPRGNADASPVPLLTDAQSKFYNSHFAEAEAMAREIVQADPSNLAAQELRSAAVLFQLKRLIPESTSDKDEALKQCATCTELLATFKSVTTEGLAQARAQLKTNPDNIDALFFLAKLDLNQLWLNLATLGRRSGWSEYWEGRHSLDAVLERDPHYLRARVARAWIDYIVDTRTAWGIRWVLGGGNRKRAVSIMGEAALVRGDYYANTEARFGLWEIQVREKKLVEATATAQALLEEFPGNGELGAFVNKHRSAVP